MRLRRILFQVHLYAGLTVGALLAVTGLSGSVLVFGEALERRLDAEVRRVEPGGPAAPVSRLLASVAAHEGAPPRHLRFPEAADAPVEGWMDAAGARRVFVHPSTGEVLGARERRQSVVGTVRALHTQWLSGERGKWVVGASGWVLMALCLSGLVLWWPGRRKLALGFTVRRPLRWHRGNYDVHKVGGILGLALLLLAALTGTSLVFPKPFERALEALTGTQARRAPPTAAPPLGEPLPLDTLLATADAALPGARTTRVDLPTSAEAPLRVRKRFPQEPHPNGMSFVYVDRFSGAVLRTENALRAPLAARLFALRYPLHIGSLGGLATRLLAAATGLLPALLYFTGFFLWRVRLRRSAEAKAPPRLVSSPERTSTS